MMKTVLEKHKSLDSGKLTDIVTNYKAHALPEMTPSPFKSRKKNISAINTKSFMLQNSKDNLKSPRILNKLENLQIQDNVNQTRVSFQDLQSNTNRNLQNSINSNHH